MAVLTLVSLSCGASPLKDPKRLVNERTVDLSPLFTWWGKRTGERPLSAWVHVTGSVVGTNGWGWVVEGRVKNTSAVKADGEGKAGGRSSKIILKSPPLKELALFEALSSREKALRKEREALNAQANQAGGKARELSSQEKLNSRYHVRTSSALRQQTRHWKAVEKDAKERIKTIDKQLKQTNEQLAAYPARDHYAVDCLALHTGERENGLEVYDHGVPFK